MNNKSFGALPNLDSIRIYDYDSLPKKEIPVGSSNITDYSIPEERMPRVLDQGNVGSCVAHSIVSVLETLHYVETGEWVKLSPGYIYGHHRSSYATGWGMVPSDAIERTRSHGSVPETVFNEHVEMDEMKKIVQVRPELEEIAEKYKIKSFVSISKADKNARWEAVKEAFLSYQLPLIADVPTFFGEPHCIILYGFKEKNGERYFKFQNSWGEDYKDKGRSEIRIDCVKHVYLLLDEEMSMPFEDVPESAWYYKNVLNLYASGLINGVNATEFNPDGGISRAELCAIIDRLMKKIETKDAAMMESVYDYVDRRIK